MTENRALVRALQIERATRKLCERRLRELMTHAEFGSFQRFCRETSVGCVRHLARKTTDGPDAG